MNSQFFLCKLLNGLILVVLLNAPAAAAPADFDANFGANGKVVTAAGSVSSQISKVVPTSDGKIIAVGYGRGAGSQVTQFLLMRFNHDGSPDASVAEAENFAPPVWSPVCKQIYFGVGH